MNWIAGFTIFFVTTLLSFNFTKNSYENKDIQYSNSETRALASVDESEEQEVTADIEGEEQAIRTTETRRVHHEVASYCRESHIRDRTIFKNRSLKGAELSELLQSRLDKCMQFEYDKIDLLRICRNHFSQEGLVNCYDFLKNHAQHMPDRRATPVVWRKSLFARFEFVNYVVCDQGKACGDLEKDLVFYELYYLPKVHNSINPQLNKIITIQFISIIERNLHSKPLGNQFDPCNSDNPSPLCEREIRYAKLKGREMCFSQATLATVWSCLTE